MQRTVLQGVLFSMITALVGAGLLNAAGPGGRTTVKKSGPVKTVTTTVISGGSGSLTARYETVTVETRRFCVTRTSTHTTFTSTLDFTGYGLSDGDEVRFAVQKPGGPVEVIGTVYAVGQIATLTLSSRNGDQIPFIEEGDGFGFSYPGSSGEIWITEDFFGAPVITVTSCGR